MAVRLSSVSTAVFLTATPVQDPQKAAVAIVQKIQRADYEGDRIALKGLAEELSPLAGHSELTSRMLYWRGFARWRRAMNGAGTDDVARGA